MKKFSQNGFTLVEGLLLIIALAVITGVGFYIYNSTQKNSDDNTVSVSQTQSVKKSSSSTKKYLKIPGLGIKFELNDKLKNAYYAKVDGYYYVSVKELGDVCSAGGSSGGLGIMAIVKGKVGELNDTIAADSNWTQEQLDQSGFKKVGDTYYGFMRGNTPCYDPDAPNAAQTAKEVDSYRQAFIEQEDTFQKL